MPEQTEVQILCIFKQSDLKYNILLFLQLISDQTPLHIAASVSNCRSTAMSLLMHPKIKPDLINNSKDTAADIARRAGRFYDIFEMGHSAFSNVISLID